MKNSGSALLLITATIAIGCGRPHAISSVMTAKEKQALEANLERLESVLRDHSPSAFAKLAPPATTEELATLKSGLGGAEVEALEVWYGWHNGKGRPALLSLGDLLSLQEALADRELVQKIPLVDAKRRSALKLLDDRCGDGYFLDIASPKPRVFYHMLEDPYPRDYGTLHEFVAFIADVHAAGIASENDEGFIEFDLDRLEEMSLEYVTRIRR